MTQTVHATCVAVGDNAVLLMGASGTGKSTIALELMAYGATLVSDDQVMLLAENDVIVASAPPTITGLIEARGFGVLKAQAQDSASIVMVVNLDVPAVDRMPARRVVTLLGCDLPLFQRPDGGNLAPAILQFLRAGISDR
ncbi:MAG: HPr kinase/phosphatase C-terminal domain-containing protein [Yoonia sp.]|nr:HPr kinase/phosphatase C-terminal domain-containing protein [Yoonia sp.]